MFGMFKPLQAEDDDDPAPVSTAPAIPPPKLKITLKLPANNPSSNSAGTATPDDMEMDYAAFKRTPKRRAKGMISPIYHGYRRQSCQLLWLILIVAKVIHDNDIESEDPISRSDSGEMSAQEVPSRSTETPSVSTSTRPLTTRQAVLASMVDSSHVSLSESVAFTTSILILIFW